MIGAPEAQEFKMRLEELGLEKTLRTRNIPALPLTLKYVGSERMS